MPAMLLITGKLYLLLGLLFSMGLCSKPVTSVGEAAANNQRLRPPTSLTCSRDHLTSFQGRVLAYQRSDKALTIRVRTDEETTESFTLKWGAAEKVEKWFLLRGEEFKAEHWQLIESAPSKLKAETRVIVWVCDDGSKPIFDWRPKEQ